MFRRYIRNIVGIICILTNRKSGQYQNYIRCAETKVHGNLMWLSIMNREPCLSLFANIMAF